MYKMALNGNFMVGKLSGKCNIKKYGSHARARGRCVNPLTEGKRLKKAPGATLQRGRRPKNESQCLPWCQCFHLTAQ